MTSRARFPPIVVHSHARSGSTLLLELLGRDPQVWTAYEPLQDVRQLPPTAPVVTDRCRSAETGAAGDPLMAKCPWRDATLLVALLACDTLPLLATAQCAHVNRPTNPNYANPQTIAKTRSA